MVSIAGFEADLVFISKVVKAAAVIAIGYAVSRMAGSLTGRVVSKEINPHLGRMSRNAVFYLIMGVSLITAAGVFIEVTTILAAAGIVGIALGVAAQKSVSNVISGLFLLADMPFEIGDAVDIAGDAGVVLDISLFSTRLRTFDNKYLRIPNDTVASAKIINLTYYDLRRLDLPVGIAYKEDLEKALSIINRVVANHKKVLVEPEPQILVTDFGESSIDIEIRAWVQRTEIFNARTELIRDIKKSIDEAGIEIPFHHRTLYFGAGEIDRLKGN